MNENPLGKKSEYSDRYDNALLFPVPRCLAREKMEIDSSIFSGFDIWNCHELSWLNEKGKPIVGILRIVYPANSEFIVESKSLKLYLNSLNSEKFKSQSEVLELIKNDLEALLKTDVECYVYKTALEAFKFIEIKEDLLIDYIDISLNKYHPDKSLLVGIKAIETCNCEHYSNLLRTNCPVTGQPDWGTVYIKYQGKTKLKEESLLKYIVSYRNAQDFHEVCCEKIFHDIYEKINPKKLLVKCYYTRRGGIDINPVRISGYLPDDTEIANHLWRQ